MASVRTTMTFLELSARRSGLSRLPPPGTALLRVEAPSPAYYRYLYDLVGRRWTWVERRFWSDERLAAWLNDPNVALYVLHLGGEPSGYAEIDFSDGEAPRIVYFGLAERAMGRRLGRWFLDQVLDIVFDRGAARVRLDTCTLDHPRALPMYQAAGFVAVSRIERDIKLPEGWAADIDVSDPGSGSGTASSDRSSAP